MRWRRGLLLAGVMLVVVGSSASSAPLPTRLHFTAAGDYGASTISTSGVLTALAAGGSDAHLALGDLSYGVVGEEDAWCSFVKQRIGETFPFELVSGNHESNGLNGNINDFSACLPNQLPGVVGTYGRQYYVDVPQGDPLVRFVMISPNLGFAGGQWNYPAGSDRYKWVGSAIDGARATGVPWVVVGMHKPCLSMGNYQCDIGADLANLLLSKKVDLVLSGHEHLYQRTKQLSRGTGCATLTIGTYNPACVVDSGDALIKGAGTVFATVGTGGVGLRAVNAVDPEAAYFAATSGSNQNPTWGYGDFDVTADRMSMQFKRGAGGTFTDSFTMTRDTDPPTNQAPVAAFLTTATGLSASFDASASSDADGVVASYAWLFGDGSSGSGPSPQHAFSAPGTYSVTLTVTDDKGATGSVSHDVAITAAPEPGLLARDTFDRTVASGWGSAPTGGAWTIRGGVSRVVGGSGSLTVASGSTVNADLMTVSSQSTLLTANFAVDKLADANYVTLVGRQIGAESYVARLRLQADGGAKLYLLRGSGTQLGGGITTFPPGSFLPQMPYRMALQVKGVTPTQLAAKVWKASEPEPVTWQRTASDGFSGLQAPGRIGVFSYLPSSAVNGPVSVLWSDFTATDAS